MFYEATRLLQAGDTLQSAAVYRQCLEIDPTLAEAHANLAYLLEKERRLDEAESHYKSAIGFEPFQTQILINYGAMLASQKRFVEAETLYRQALAIDNTSCSALSNLGVLLACMRRDGEAERCYRAAMSIDPDHRMAQFNLAYVLLRQGRLEEGWLRLEARDWYAPFEKVLNCPRWRGEPLPNKAIVITLDAGHGDMIHFCRYASLLKQAGAARVSLLCHPGLKRILSSLSGVDEVIAADQPLSSCDWDYWVPVLSLPYGFRTTLDSIPANIPYLAADPERVGYWASQIAATACNMNVGLVWKGNPRFENDAERSLPSLSLLAPLWEVPGIRFFSLQKGAGEDEIGRHAANLPLVPLGHLVEDFSDTAAIVMNLDLIITVDTAVAHLAGALGKACWVLLPHYKTDWRWFEHRTDSPWYPKVMRLFRQGVAGDWASTIESVKTALQITARGLHDQDAAACGG